MKESNKPSIGSAILEDLVRETKNPNDDQVKYLRKILNNPTKIERIFKTSEHQLKTSAFHERCDNIKKTLTLVRTEFGKTIGWFTHNPWNSSGELVDSGKKVFIFSLGMKEKFVP